MSGTADVPRPRRDTTGPSALPDGAVDSAGPFPRESTTPAAPRQTQPATAGESAHPGTSIRASDAEREDAVQQLHQALGEGRLDLAETETRVAAAYTAVYREELPVLLDDLPEADAMAALMSGADAPSWHTVWTALVWRARASLWDGPGAAGRNPPRPEQRRLAALLLVLAGLWFLACATIGAVL